MAVLSRTRSRLNVASLTLRIDTPRVFKPLLAPSRYKGAYGGRGSGKSHFFAEKLVEDCIAEPGESGEGMRAVCIREVQKSLADSSKRLIEDKIEKLGVSTEFKILRDAIVTPKDGVIRFQGMQDHTAESIKSLEGFKRAWWEEAQTASTRSLEMLRPTIRAPRSELWFSWNPRNANDPVDQFLRGINPPPDAVVVRSNYSDNPWFPAELAAERAYDEKHKRDRYGHIWLGEYEPKAIGAIWDRLVLHQGRREKAPDLARIVVAVDPAASDTPESDHHGIVACALGADNRGYVLADASMQGAPQQWGRQAIALYDKFSADCIVVERNQGGDMVRHVLETIRPGIRIVEVTATRGKHVRAEPISALYSEGRVSHVGTFGDLEDQMCQMTANGYQGEGSPDRCDALVWALTELFPQITVEPTKPARPPSFSAGGWMG